MLPLYRNLLLEKANTQKTNNRKNATMYALQSYRLFTDLVQVHLGNRARLSATPTARQWEEVFGISREQALATICFAAVKALPSEQQPADKELWRKWLWQTTKTMRANELLELRTREALAYFRTRGFRCCVLKGQGAGGLYPQPQLRTPGDIDLWLVGGRQRIYNLSKRELGNVTGANYHHIHYPIFHDVEVEAHIYPSFLSHPLLNRRFRRFCAAHQPDDTRTTPPLAFDRVYILLHCYRHVCGHGVGLKQFLDYYFVLRQGFTEEERQETVHVLGSLRMTAFARAAMWVMKHVFGLEDRFLLCEPDEREGRFLLSEIFQTGNMGHSETRFDWSGRTPLQRFLMNQRRNWHLLAHYPHEVLWSPAFSIVSFAYRKCKGLA